MAAISVQVPYPVFYDRDGDPLDNGNIYIGVANLDPVTNPIAVYYDEALTLPASQPLKTSNGYIYRNGTPAQLYVNAVNFSITVNDKKDLLVYSFPDGTGLSPNANGIDYDPPFTGALTSGYTVADKLAQSASVKDFGAVGNGVADDTAAIQAAFDAGGVVAIPAGDYKITAPITIDSNVEGVLWHGRLVSTYAGVQDVNLHPAVIFDTFSGFVDGVLHLENSASTAATASDGVQFLNCNRIWISGIRVKNQRFGIIMSTTDYFHIGYIDANTMRGWQGGSNDNGGSIITLAGCTHGRIDIINGVNIHKAAVYFSVDGVSGDNFDIHVGDIIVDLSNPTLPVSSGLALRSAVNVSVGSLRSTGGIAGLFCAREEVSYNIDQIKIDKIYAQDNTQVSSNSNLVVVQGDAAYPVGNIELGQVYALNSNKNSVFVFYVEQLKINSLVSVNPGERGVLISGVNRLVEIDTCDMSSAGNQEIFVSAGTTDQLVLNNVTIRERGAVDATVPINIAVDTVANIQIGSVIDETSAPAYSVPLVFGNPASTVNLSINYVKTAATYAASVRAATIDDIAGGRFFNASLPADSTWPVGTEIYKSSPTSGGPNSWVKTTTGFKASANLT